ncbi:MULTISPECIES: Dps family protein [Vibrio]|uniref:DNA protection during starvation protein n=1 Tax=Vibrio proteolyticus NBRC 13287 TaxID=1219065 RepID=U3BFV7_VIBPR|nr:MULTISPECIES: Dps family protein [Vibrio]NAW57568.1 DNA starvation/stationary phase protection protein [Vibrio sp. V36_P2S2PM302]NAX20233.1 DNA starvation/stationary phase protection protein [Vibrio sp. V39_P1S14PM300]NAX28399.1 DNA starvation/stationary phase protection protein [Vibrio sp. V38_P2S17PM301]NAX30244.1 DNA starvation/stationary phase protection protein [Vibrio sp. V37_P2S8PM304]GAD65598.1 DNA protection during starvation protein [Vibrio proteolyticus NBRC 13287]
MSSQTNLIGLDSNKAQELAAELNQLLALYQVLYMNTRGYHWNIKGQQFFELHVKFEEIYTDLQTKIDELAERILTLGFTPDHSFSRYLENSAITEHKNATSGTECVEGLVNGFSVLLGKEREILEQAGNADDEGTAALMGDYIREQEKLMWMLNAYLQ